MWCYEVERRCHIVDRSYERRIFGIGKGINGGCGGSDPVLVFVG
jgi:hypothetical protein